MVQCRETALGIMVKKGSQKRSAHSKVAIQVRFSRSDVNDDVSNNDETNENESLNQEETSTINNETSIPAPPNPSSVNRIPLRSDVNSIPLINHLRIHRLIV